VGLARPEKKPWIRRFGPFWAFPPRDTQDRYTWRGVSLPFREGRPGKIKAFVVGEKKGIQEVVDEALRWYRKGKRKKTLPEKKYPFFQTR